MLDTFNHLNIKRMSDYITEINFLRVLMREGRKSLIEQKLEKNYLELEGKKYCDSCNMYIENKAAYNNHVAT